MTSERIAALRQALELSPDNHQLRLVLADMLRDDGQIAEAVEQYRVVLQHNQLPREALIGVGRLALQVQNLDVATQCLATARQLGVIEGVSQLQTKIDEHLADQGVVRMVLNHPKAAPAEAQDYLDDQEKVTFGDIGGLDEVKKIIHRLIILPMSRPDIYQKYKKSSGGGVLLYGPPGCGKTMLARATAGECNLPFFNIRIEDVLDPYIGVSERNLHEAFTLARQQAPCVVFIDEIDAMAYARRKQQGSASRALVDQMLQELDAIGSDNQRLLILAATNAPWDVDDALLRPGRFDRRVFVPPPDVPARQRILELLLADIPTHGIDLRRLAQTTPLFSGADLKGLIDQAIDLVIEAALDTTDDVPLTMQHLEMARTDLRPTTLDWLARARNYVEFANQDDRYKEVATFLRSREVKGWKDPS